MWLIIGIVLTLVWTLWKELPQLWKERKYKDLTILSVVTLFVTIVSTAESLNANLPNPLDCIAAALGPYPKAVYSFFK